MFRMFRICSEFSDNVQNLFRPFRQCSECSDTAQNVQTFQTMFRLCSECSESVQNVQSMFRMFRIFSQCSECSESVQTFSEFLAQKLVYSEFLDFVVSQSHDLIHLYLSSLTRYSSNNTH
jgi:hypothetical protein